MENGWLMNDQLCCPEVGLPYVPAAHNCKYQVTTGNPNLYSTVPGGSTHEHIYSKCATAMAAVMPCYVE